MKTALIIYLLFINSLMGINDKNINDTTSENITCYDCSRLYILEHQQDFQITDKKLKMQTEYDNECNKISLKTKGNLLCKINIKMLEKTNAAVATYSISTKEDCMRENQNKIQDVVCMNSLCKKLSLCCKGNLCNHNDYYNLIKLPYYSNPIDKNIKDNYSKFTNTQCELSLSSDTPELCIVSTNQEIYDYNKNISKLIVPKKDSDKIKIVPDNKDDNDMENNQEFIIAINKTKLSLPNEVVLRIKMWLTFLEEDKNQKSSQDLN